MQKTTEKPVGRPPIYDKKMETNTYVRLPAELYRQVRDLALERNVSIPHIIRMALEEYFAYND